MRTRDYETGPGETRSQVKPDAQRVAPKPGVNSPGPLATLQRSVGNQALGQLAASGLQGPKLKASAPDFKPTRFASRVSSPVPAPRIQRKCACGGTCASCAEEESETIHRSSASPALRLSAPAIQRAPAAQEKHVSAETGDHAKEESTFIVEDDAKSIKPGQMHKTQFLAQLRGRVCSTADAVLASVGKSTKSCPYLEQWLAFYGSQSAAHIERVLRKYAPEAAHSKKAQDYFSSVDHRVRKAVTIWAKTGKITGVPPDVPLMPTAPGMQAQQNAGASAKEKHGKDHGAAPQKNILQKHRGENGTETADPEAVRESLGPGRVLDGGVRSRMESAFGSDFSQVRLHTDGNAGQLSTQMNARAFTIGNDVAFAGGEYQPGTLVGDALIAHELAHVVQQSGPMSSSGPTTHGHASYAALESDADVSAVGAVTSLWTGTKGKLHEIGKNAPPRLKSRLKLQRCAAAAVPAVLELGAGATEVGVLAGTAEVGTGLAVGTGTFTAAAPEIVGAAAPELVGAAAPEMAGAAAPELTAGATSATTSTVAGTTATSTAASTTSTLAKVAGVAAATQLEDEPRRERRNKCQEQWPSALTCGPDDDPNELVRNVLFNKGFSFEDVIDIDDPVKQTAPRKSEKIQDCNFAPGESYHFRVKLKRGRYVDVSMFRCLCCKEDGESGWQWREGHISPGK